MWPPWEEQMKHEMKPKQNPGENPLTCPNTYGCVFILLIAFVNFIAVFYYSVYDQITRDTKTTIRMKQFRFVLCRAVPSMYECISNVWNRKRYFPKGWCDMIKLLLIDNKPFPEQLWVQRISSQQKKNKIPILLLCQSFIHPFEKLK